MSAPLFSLPAGRRTWILYLLLLTTIAALCFGGLRHHLLNTHDADTFADHLRIDQDWTFFFSPDKAQASGRPFAEAVKYGAYRLWGNDPGAFHLLVVALHLLASLLLALLSRRLGASLELALLAGLLFLVNVSHFEAVQLISTLDYALALCCGLLAVRFSLKATPTGRLLTALFLLLGLMAHLATAAVLPFILFYRWGRGEDMRALFRQLLIAGGLGILAVALLLAITSRQTSTWWSLTRYTEQSPVELLGGMLRVLLWFVSRLLTTAHWLPLRIFEQQEWELFLGGALLVGLGLLIWRRTETAWIWAGWLLLNLVPFLLLTESTILELPAGPSRYLYFASAGSSLLLAWLLLEGARRLGRAGRYLLPLVVLSLLLSSQRALHRSEALSFYTSGRCYIAGGQMADGIRQLRRAIARAPEVIPLGDAYFRLAYSLPLVGEDPIPVLQRGLEQFPNGLWLNAIMAAAELETDDVRKREEGQRRLARTRQSAATLGQSDAFAYNLAGFYHNLGKGYVDREEYIRAIRAFRQARTYRPQEEKYRTALSGAYALLGIDLGEREQLSGAASAYREALAVAPENIAARINLGWALYLQGEWDGAIAQFREILARQSNSYARFNLALVLLARGDTDEAETAYARAIERFGADEGKRIGADEDLRNLIKKGIRPEVGQRILATYWP